MTVIAIVASAIVARYYLHMFQLESYQLDGYVRWLKKHSEKHLGWTLNIGVGASEISYSDSKSITWEVNGQARSLFCMDNDISKEDFLNMAFEIQ